MPSTIASLFGAIGLEPDGCVPWGTPVPEARPGVYVVSLTASADLIDRAHAVAPLSNDALDVLLQVCPDLRLHGQPATRSKLEARIGSYWLADECVLYIGLAGRSVRTRVRQYYRTPLGAAKPHKGGWWLKTLASLDDLHVHYAATGDYKHAEEAMLRAFAAAVSDTSTAALPYGEPVMPFANLRDGDWRRRNHGISGAAIPLAASASPRIPVTQPKRRPTPSPGLPGRLMAEPEEAPHDRSVRRSLATTSRPVRCEYRVGRRPSSHASVRTSRCGFADVS